MVVDKETQRLEARRAREQERLKKLGPGRLRNIGADIAGVKNQVEEKQAEAAAAREAQRVADDEDAAIRRYLLQVESEAALAKRQELRTLANDWQLQAAAAQRARASDAAERAEPIDPTRCAVGAGQLFAGEDPSRLERTRLQALQLQQWTREQLADKQRRQADEAEAEAQYAAFLGDVERLQQALFSASETERARVARELQAANAQLLALQQARERQRAASEQAENARDVAAALASDLVSENPLQAQLPGVGMDRRVRVDHWKGLSVADTRRVLGENDALVAERQRQQQREQQAADEDARRGVELGRILAREEHAAQQRRVQGELELQRERARQASEHAAREQQQAEAARGRVEPAFFQRFGASYR